CCVILTYLYALPLVYFCSCFFSRSAPHPDLPSFPTRRSSDLNTRLKKPTIISSQLWSPQITSLVGSALSGLFGELSKCAVHSIFVPLGRTSGLARVYQSCQCQL